jgi:uncharacterized protein YjbI with pentapeptide repeats
MRPIPAWRWTLAALVVFAAVAVGVTIWLLTVADQAKAGSERATAQLDAVRTGLAAGAGAGAAVGLILAFRRQHHQEVSTIWTDQDATERRITELYTKAVEQLGSDKAPVRLGGLYALERLAQDNPGQRQTIVNVICAYLRMPFSPTAPASEPVPGPGEGAGEPAPGAEMAALADSGDAWQQERQVRLTAQRVLGEHLRAAPPDTQPSADSATGRFWPGIRLDLTGATLIDFSLEGAVLAGAGFGGATFTGAAGFGGATFTGDAGFDEATFAGGAWFGGATFTGAAHFGGATFTRRAGFYEATFTGGAVFGGATFTGAAHFDGATFAGGAAFDEATFTGGAEFYKATFTGGAGFDEATFAGGARFDEATFTGAAHFDGATFTRSARFDGATFTGGARFDGATFTGAAYFGGATFTSAARFDRATFPSRKEATSFEGSRVLAPGADHIWPKGWCTGETGDGEHTIVRVDSSTRS